MNSELMRIMFPKSLNWRLKRYSETLYNLACIPANAMKSFAEALNKK